MNRSALYALLAAILFGASTPLAKQLLGEMSPALLAGLLYLGSGLGLAMARVLRDRTWQPSGLATGEWPWLMGAIVFGGVLGPLALMMGLRYTASATASLMLNLEAVLTAVIAWIAFKENADRRVVLGMAAIVLGGVVLAWPANSANAPSTSGSSGLWGLAAVATACLCWAIDNNLTRKVSASDALFIASSKGLIAGLVNVGIAMFMNSTGAALPSASTVLFTMLLGFLGYGISLVLFVLALRGLGTARTGAYFSTAPFIGAAIAILWLGESISPAFMFAIVFMGIGVWLHLTEHHAHDHTHEPLAHTHAHVHDEHHQHAHDASLDKATLHTHEHVHAIITHKHPHYPDIHHRHLH